MRYTWCIPPTRYQYTGQYSYTAEFGLYFYNARWYDPALGRFAQADTLVPEPGDDSASSAQAPQAWDRYAFVYNNPVRYNDPSGHDPCLPKHCGYMHDYDSNSPPSPWLDKILDNDSNQSNDKSNNLDEIRDLDIATLLQYGAAILDTGGVFLSDIEAGIVIVAGVIIIVSGCASIEACLPAIALAWSVDYGVTSLSMLGQLENALGLSAFVLTGTNDILLGNTGPTAYGYTIGKDSLVSARNAIAGLIPESAWDAAVSNSQLKYDLDRLLGNKPGGSILITDSVSLVKQILLEDWW